MGCFKFRWFKLLLSEMAISGATPKRSSLGSVFSRAGFSNNKKKKRCSSFALSSGSSSSMGYDYMDDEDGTMEMVQLGADRPKNVLILMSDTGGGHRASAEAIRDAFKLEFGDEYNVRFCRFFFLGFASCFCLILI